MSKNIKTLVALIVVAVLIIIGLMFWGNSGSNNVAPVTNQVSNRTYLPPQNVAPQSTTNASLDTSPTDSSDAALQQDVNSIDAQVSNLNSDLSATTTQVTQ